MNKEIRPNEERSIAATKFFMDKDAAFLIATIKKTAANIEQALLEFCFVENWLACRYFAFLSFLSIENTFDMI